MCFEFPILFSTLKEEIYFGVAIQRCWEHKTRNIINDEAVDPKDSLEGIHQEMGGTNTRKRPESLEEISTSCWLFIPWINDVGRL